MIQGFVIWKQSKSKDGNTICEIYNGYGSSWSEFITQEKLK